jgi:hypothetical protein
VKTMHNAFLIFLLIVLAYGEKFEKKNLILKIENFGVLNIDSMTFPKLIPSQRNSMVILVYSKTEIGDYGTESIRSDYYAFAKKAQTEGEADNVLFTQLVVNGAENRNLAIKLGMEENFKFPKLILIPVNGTKTVAYPNDHSFRLYELVVFLSKHTDFFLQQPGRSKLLNQLRKSFFATFDSSKRLALIEAAREENEKQTPFEKHDAEYYINLLENITKTGRTVLDREIASTTEQFRNTITNNPAEARVHEIKLNVLLEIQESLRSPNFEL